MSEFVSNCCNFTGRCCPRDSIEPGHSHRNSKGSPARHSNNFLTTAIDSGHSTIAIDCRCRSIAAGRCCKSTAVASTDINPAIDTNPTAILDCNQSDRTQSTTTITPKRSFRIPAVPRDSLEAQILRLRASNLCYPSLYHA